MRAAAADAGLPLIALHREVPFVKVTEAIHTELISRRYGLLREGEVIKQRLIDVMLRGEGISEVLRTFAEIVGNPVFLESAEGGLLFHAGDSDDLDAWERLGERRERISLEQPVPMGRALRCGRLVILATARSPTELDAIALGHATSIVALALLRAREEEQLVVRERGNLLADLAEGVLTGADTSRQAARLGFRVVGRSLLAFAFTEIPQGPAPSRAALLADLQRALDGRGVSALVGGRTREEPLYALVGLPRSDRRRALAGEVAAVIHRTWEDRNAAVRAVITVDGPSLWEHAGAALATAAQTLGCAAVLPEASWHDSRELELERLLWALRGGARLDEFVQRNLGPLLDHDRERKLVLLPTLEALCRNGGRKAQAARALHLQRQALYHRIARIESLLEVSLSDPGRLLTLHLALRARFYVVV